MTGSFDYDVIVIGSGYGGASAAEYLASAGMKVGIVERGTWWGSFTGHRAMPETLPQILSALVGFNLSAFGRGLRIPLSNRGLIEAAIHSGTIVINASAVGGNSVVSGMLMQRPAPQFFDALPPEVTAAGLDPHYQRIERALEVSGGPQDQRKLAVLTPLAAAQKWTLGPTPQAIRWTSDDPAARPPCTECNRCMFSCNVGAKLSFDRNLIPSAMKAGAVVHDLCTVQTVERAVDGYEVRLYDGKQRRNVALRAPRVVLAAGTLNTLKILLRSTAVGHLAPIPGLGQHFSMASDWISLYRLPSENGPQPIKGHIMDAQIRVPGSGSEFDHQILCATGPLIPDSWLLRAIQGKRPLSMFGFGPDALNGQVTWRGGALVVRHEKQALVARIQTSLDRVAQEFGRKKPPRPLDEKRRARPWISFHPVGGCRMGADPARGVVDFRGEVFGHRGLYVADASVFPTMTIGGPQLSVSALASWIAERIAKDPA